MYNEKLIITIPEGIHLPLEFCDTCPYHQRCPSANTEEARERNIRLKKLFDNKDFFVEEASTAYNIPKLPIYVEYNILFCLFIINSPQNFHPCVFLCSFHMR